MWPLFRKAKSSSDEGKELAKRQREQAEKQREVADAILESSADLAREAHHVLYANHFAASFKNALRGE